MLTSNLTQLLGKFFLLSFQVFLLLNCIMKLLFQGVNEGLSVPDVLVLGTTQNALRIIAWDVLQLDQFLIKSTLGLQICIDDTSLPILIQVACRSLVDVFPRLLMFVSKHIFCFEDV